MSITKVSGENVKTVLFLVLPTLEYKLRMGMSLALILAAFYIQFQLDQTGLGMVLLVCGNLLLLVKGYDNRVKFAGYHPEAAWTEVDMHAIRVLKFTEEKVKRWDRDFLDISNIPGAISFGLTLIVMVFVYFSLLPKPGTESLQILIVDAGILLFPHWITGLRRISNVLTSGLTMKIDEITNILNRSRNQLKRHKVHYYMLLKGNKVKIPTDVKFRVNIADAPEDFLGLYGQVVLNDVQGNKFPYFYCVLVARKDTVELAKLEKLNVAPTKQKKDAGFLTRFFTIVKAEDRIITEYKLQRDVQVLVVRQFTTRTSGYHTKAAMEDRILRLSISMAESLSGSTKVARG